MNINGNLQNGIGIQMGQIKAIEIKETAEKGRNRKSETAEKKRNINHGFVGILCWNSDPMANLPRAELLRRKDPDGHEMEKVRLRNNRHMVTCERQLAVGVDRGNHSSGRTRGFPLGRHLNSTGEQSGSRIAKGQRGSEGRKARTRARKAEAAEGAVHMGLSRSRYRFQKSAQSSPGGYFKKSACHVITRRLFLKRRCATSSLGYYLQSGRCNPF
jgi:hypothetical protein